MPDLATSPLSLIGNIIAFLVLTYKSLYDVYFNPRRFKADLVKLDMEGKDSIKALEDRNKRTNSSTTFAFAATAFSFLFLIGADIVKNDETSASTDKVLEGIHGTLQDQNRRLKRIEDTLWPPHNPGTYGQPTPPPYDPVGTQAALDAINKTLVELKGNDKKLNERLERTIRALNELTLEVQEHQKTMEQLRQMLAAPAG